MTAFLALIAFLQTANMQVQTVKIPDADGTVLQAALVQPVGPAHGPAVVALHGCGGPFPHRDGPWAVALARAGHIVLLPDSFGSRGLGSLCKVKHRPVRPFPTRRNDAIAAAQWLAGQPGTPAGGVVLIGWSNGGSTVLWTDDAAHALPPGLFRQFVAFYPGCRLPSRSKDWRPAAKLMILMGANDNWTPVAPCRRLAARFPGQVKLIIYPDSWHDFDALNRPVKVRTGLAYTAGRNGIAAAGTNKAARADAFRRVPAFIDGG